MRYGFWQTIDPDDDPIASDGEVIHGYLSSRACKWSLLRERDRD